MPEGASLPDPSSGSAACALLPDTQLACSPTGTASTTGTASATGKTAVCTAGIDMVLVGGLSTLSWSCWTVLGAVLPGVLAVCSCSAAAPAVAASVLTDASEADSEAAADPAAGAGEACKVTPGPVSGGETGVSFRLPSAGGLDGNPTLFLVGS